MARGLTSDENVRRRSGTTALGRTVGLLAGENDARQTGAEDEKK